jgi:hypothetical protein
MLVNSTNFKEPAQEEYGTIHVSWLSVKWRRGVLR